MRNNSIYRISFYPPYFIYMLVKKYIGLFPDSFRYRLIRGDRDSL